MLNERGNVKRTEPRIYDMVEELLRGAVKPYHLARRLGRVRDLRACPEKDHREVAHFRSADAFAVRRGRSWRVPPGAVLGYPPVRTTLHAARLPAPSAYVGRLSFPLAEERVVTINASCERYEARCFPGRAHARGRSSSVRLHQGCRAERTAHLSIHASEASLRRLQRQTARKLRDRTHRI